MAFQCPRCRRQYDATLFEFGRTVTCECGSVLDMRRGHTSEAAVADGPEPITPATWEYITSERIAHSYDDYFRYNSLFRYDTQVLGRWFGASGALLDLGCGTGRHVVHFARQGFTVTGVDLSEAMLTQCRRKLADAGCGATLVQGDLTRLEELGLGQFDYAICMFSTLGMIYGAANRLAFLREVRERLVEGGKFALHVHNRWHNLWYPDGREYLWRALRDHVGRRPEAFQKDVDGYRGIRNMSLYVYSAREIRQVLGQAGFSVLEMLHLNQTRNGPLTGLARGLRANGFLILCGR
jgi:SAM-dependent methyltransferase